jgi:uncharacterized protein (DUF2062 family)
MVASQLKILMPVGTAMAKLAIAKKVTWKEFIPTVNMWCAQTAALINPIRMVAATLPTYKVGHFIRENIAEKVGREDHIELPRIQHELHGTGINDALFQLYSATIRPIAFRYISWPPRTCVFHVAVLHVVEPRRAVRGLQADWLLRFAIPLW